MEGEVSIHVPIKAEVVDEDHEDKEICIRRVLTEVARLKKGQYFGDMALLDYKPRSATIKCVVD